MNRTMIPLIFAFISGLLVIVTAIYQYREKLESEKKAKERQISLDSANAELLSVQKRLNEKTEYISNYLTGGDSYPYIGFTDLLSKEAINLAFILYNDGDFPLYDIDATMYDYNVLKQKEKDTKGLGGEFEKHPDHKLIRIDDYKSAKVFSLTENLPPKSMRYVDAKFPLKESKYHFIINSRNGTITERLAILQDEGSKFIFIIEIYDSKEILLKRIEGKFINDNNRKNIEKALNEIPKALKYVFVN